MNARRAAGIAGILFPLVTLQTVLGLLPHPEVPQDPTSEEASAFFRDHYWVKQAQLWFHIVGILLFGTLMVGIVTLLRAADRGHEFWIRLAGFAAAGMVAAKVGAMMVLSALVSVHASLDGRLLLSLNDAFMYAQSLIVYFGPFTFGALAVAILGTRALPAATGWASAILAVVCLVASVFVISPGLGWATFPAFFLILLWSLGVGASLLFGRANPTSSPVPSTTT